MSEPKFTKGPWTAEDESVNSITIRATSKSAHKLGQEIASVMNEEESNLTPRMWADAQLIAAAPALYEAIVGLMKAYGAADGRNGNSGKCWDDARATIALVEGK